MPTTYKGLTVPLSSDLADGPAAFRDYTDSLPYKVFATVADRDAVTAPPNGSLCFTVDTGTLWLRKAGVWQPVYPVDEDFIYAAVGSQSVLGVRDIVAYAGAAHPYPVRVSVQAVMEYGFGATGPSTCSMDVFRYSDNTATTWGAPGVAPVATWAQLSLNYSWLVAAGASCGFKVRGNGINFAGGNCYFQAHATYKVQAI